MAGSDGVRLASPALKADPYPFYARLRAETPVLRVVLPDRRRAWLVTRYDDVAALLKDARFAKDRANALAPGAAGRAPWLPRMFAPLMRSMLDRDDPDHARLRKLVQAAFTARRVDALGQRTQAIADALVARMAQRGQIDLMAEFALPLPVAVISDMLGVPEGDRRRFARWSRTLIENTMSPLSLLRALPHLVAFVRYLRGLIAARRAAPRDDLTSALVQAEAQGDRLDADELLAMLAILLTAGHETTTNLIGNGMLALLENPHEMSRLRDHPSLIESAVEELLRFANPVELTTFRFARGPVRIADTAIDRGDIVLGAIASANRDGAQFADADRLDLGRTPNRHLAFGMGGHYCVGAPLARMEGAIAITTLLRRLPALQLATPARNLAWRGGLIMRGLRSLPCTVSR